MRYKFTSDSFTRNDQQDNLAHAIWNMESIDLETPDHNPFDYFREGCSYQLLKLLVDDRNYLLGFMDNLSEYLRVPVDILLYPLSIATREPYSKLKRNYMDAQFEQEHGVCDF